MCLKFWLLIIDFRNWLHELFLVYSCSAKSVTRFGRQCHCAYPQDEAFHWTGQYRRRVAARAIFYVFGGGSPHHLWPHRRGVQERAPEFELLAGAVFCAVSATRTRARARFHCQVCDSRIEKGAMPFPPTGAPDSPSHCAAPSAMVLKLPPFQSNLLVSWPQMLEIGKIGENCRKRSISTVQM